MSEEEEVNQTSNIEAGEPYLASTRPSEQNKIVPYIMIGIVIFALVSMFWKKAVFDESAMKAQVEAERDALEEKLFKP